MSTPGWSRARRLAVALTIALTAGANASAIWLDVEAWPVSPYPMYAAKASPSVQWTEIYGLTAAGETRLPADRFFPPFKAPGLEASLRRLSPQRAEALMQRLAQRYEAGRRAGVHDGPAVKELRAYRMRWELEPDAGKRVAPVSQTLVARAAIGPSP